MCHLTLIESWCMEWSDFFSIGNCSFMRLVEKTWEPKLEGTSFEAGSNTCISWASTSSTHLHFFLPLASTHPVRAYNQRAPVSLPLNNFQEHVIAILPRGCQERHSALRDFHIPFSSSITLCSHPLVNLFNHFICKMAICSSSIIPILIYKAHLAGLVISLL